VRHPELTRHLGLRASQKHPVRNGPLDCRQLRYEIEAREPRPSRRRRPSQMLMPPPHREQRRREQQQVSRVLAASTELSMRRRGPEAHAGGVDDRLGDAFLA
jgi:hypothetical protein